MKRRLVTVLLFALVAAAASSTILYRVISASTRGAVNVTRDRVLVAARDLSAGALIGEGDVREVDWPVQSGDQWAKRREDVVGRGLLAAISKDEPFAESRMAPKGAGAGLASRIPTGMRAVSVHVDQLTGLSRSLLPGMHVDVISTGSAAGGPTGPGAVTRTILQNIEVFSTGQDGKDKAAAAQACDLLVTPLQAEILSQAVAQTRIELVLRNPLDKGSFVPAAIPAVRIASHTEGPRAASAPVKAATAEKTPVVAPPPAPSVEVFHGTKKIVTEVGAPTEPETRQ